MAKRTYEYDQGSSRKKGKINRIKTNTKCMACRKTAHSCWENDECMKLMQEKLTEKQEDNSETDTMKPEKEVSFFSLMGSDR